MSATSYQLTFQSEREVNAARIKDILYIFNGTYPIYYTGDGELYMFPEYQPSFSEQVVAGPNTLMDDFEEYYYNRTFKTLPENTQSPLVGIKDFDIVPKLPYQIKAENETEPQMEIQVSYQYLQKHEPTFNQFLPPNYINSVGSFSNLPTGGNAVDDIRYVRDTNTFYRWTGSSWTFDTDFTHYDNFYQMKAKVYYRPSSVGESSEDWIELSEDNYSYDILHNANEGFNVDMPGGVPNFEFDIDNADGLISRTDPYNIKINNISAGLRDIKIDLIIERSRFKVNYVGDFGLPVYNHVFETTVDSVQTLEFDEINITAAKLENFPTEEEPTRGGFTLHAPWSCNQVIEHYGKLIAFGSLEQPETAFVSAVDNFAYFPYNYTIDFNNDLKEGINSMVPFMNILVVQSDSYTWGLKGSSPQIYIDDLGQDLNPNAYQVITINSSVGSIAPRSVRPVRNRLYFLSQEGLMELTSLFATDDRYNVRPIDRNIKNLIPQDRRATAIQFDNQYWINFPSTGQTFRYYIDKQAWVKDSVSWGTFTGIHKYFIKDGKLHFVTNPTVIKDGNANVYEGVIDYSLATDFDQPIYSQFLTSKMNQDYPFHWKRYKELKLDFSVQNEYMPNKAPLELTKVHSEIVSGEVKTTFSADFIKQHYYTVAYPFEIPEETVVTVQGGLDQEVVNGMVRFRIGNTIPEQVVIEFPANGAINSQIQEFNVVDDTYDTGLVYNLRVMADNNTMIRDDYKTAIPIEKTIDTGSQFSNITFGNTNFGDVTTFVQTNKLYGNGYDINVYYKDASNIKWTLETLGIAYKMRRTRSDKRA